MPLFMDFHKIENIKLEDVVKAHMADLAVQEQYGVRYLQYWVNESEGTVFCLTEGPDAQTCEKVHQMAHGNLACAIAEVKSGDFHMLMGKTQADDHGLVKNPDNSIDLGYRTILVASIRGVVPSAVFSTAVTDLPASPGSVLPFRNSADMLLEIPESARKQVRTSITKYNGREIEWPVGDSLVAVFNEAFDAVKCSYQIQQDLVTAASEANVVLRIGISADQPLTQDGAFFTDAIRLAQRLTYTAKDNQTLISSLARKLCRAGVSSSDQMKCLNDADELFVNELLNISEQNLSDSGYSIDQLCKDLGVSRPQLYRKMTALTGRAPNNFLRDLRMEKAVTLLKRKEGNISQVALEVGYSNPSYFSKCFADKFGCMPSEVSHRQYA